MSAVVRVYVPLTAPAVAELAALGTLAGPPEEAFAVTARLEASLPDADEEEREYAAFVAAAERAAGLAVSSRPSRFSRRVVAAADVAETFVTELSGGIRPIAAVSLAGPLTTRQVVSLHVAESAAADSDLLWYDVTEISIVRDLLADQG
ncbi:MAG TPA: hypothetical protein PLL54_03685 [Dermatophilaceae bacterium]|nr:hypothetical protein [Dermatophilaceae bacterium]